MTKTIFIKAGSLVVLSGLPGAGKSSLKNNAQGFSDGEIARVWVSTDDLRKRILGTYQDLDDKGVYEEIPQAANVEVYSILREIVTARLRSGLTTIVDAVNPTESDRRAWVELARANGVSCKVLILDTSLEDCIAANNGRDARVPEFRIREYNCPESKPPEVPFKDSTLVQTPPAAFSHTSEFPYERVSRTDTLMLQKPMLENANIDVVGDVHGLLDELLVLLEKAGWQVNENKLSHPKGRKLLFLGDLVDRGPKSVALVRFVKKAVQDGVAECLKGNHEDKLVRFIDQARQVGIPRWTSFTNAETGMEFLKLPDCTEMTDFLRNLPTYKLFDDGKGNKFAFVHANMKRFEAELSLKSDMVYGQYGFKKADSDADYEARYEAGLNKWVLFRGHIPETSAQEHIFSLERHPFQKGELVLLRLDEMLESIRGGSTLRSSFEASLLTQYCDFDYDEVSRKWDLAKGVQSLVTQKMATCQFDASQMLRVFKYSKDTFYNNRWNDSVWLLKARGLVLDPAGNIVSHPFDKCFNYRENETGDGFADNMNVIAVDKLNGFLGIVSSHPLKKGELLSHTQGSFDGVFAGYLRSYVMEGKTRGLIGRFLSKQDVTLMFEVLHPEDPHIIEYPPEMMGLHLIGVRGKNQADLPWTEEEVDRAALEMELRRPVWKKTTFGELKSWMKTSKIEGWMARADNAEQTTLLKLKTPYYLTTKFLGRLSKNKIAHLYKNPKDFKKTVDEEFYPVVDALTAALDHDTFLAMSDDTRVPFVRDLIENM